MSDYGPPPPAPPPDGQPYDPNAQPGTPPGYGPPPMPRQSMFTGLGTKLGDRLSRRPEPRFAASIAGSGMALALFGLVVWTGTYLGEGFSSSGDSGPPSTNRNYLGAVLFAAVTLLGYLIVVTRQRGALATAGVVASAFGVPLTLIFLTWDLTDVSSGFPFNFDLVYWFSIVIWLASYLFVPGARGRSLYVFLVAYYFYSYVLFKSAKSDIGLRISSNSSGLKFHGFGTIAAVSLIFGLGYYLIAHLLDRLGRHGAATGLMAPAFVATVAGIAALGPDTSLTTVGVVLVMVSGVLCWYAGSFGRRFSCWAWAAGVLVGVVLVVADASPHNGTAAGISMLIVGLIVVALAQLAAEALRERDDMDPEAVVRSR